MTYLHTYLFDPLLLLVAQEHTTVGFIISTLLLLLYFLTIFLFYIFPLQPINTLSNEITSTNLTIERSLTTKVVDFTSFSSYKYSVNRNFNFV